MRNHPRSLRDGDHTVVATVPRHWQFAIRYLDEGTLEIAFLRADRALVKQVEADFKAAFAKLKTNLKDEVNK